jgi:hypothetical protein
MPHYHMPFIWRLDKEVAGAGALGDLGAHSIDIGRFLVGEVKSVSAVTRTFIPERPGPDGEMKKIEIDDAFVSVVSRMRHWHSGSYRSAAGRKITTFSDHEKKAACLNLERMNEMEVFGWANNRKRPRISRRAGIGYCILLVEPALRAHAWQEHTRATITICWTLS